MFISFDAKPRSLFPRTFYFKVKAEIQHQHYHRSYCRADISTTEFYLMYMLNSVVALASRTSSEWRLNKTDYIYVIHYIFNNCFDCFHNCFPNKCTGNFLQNVTQGEILIFVITRNPCGSSLS